jgi:S-DNA-T family DNA segregation ATPase FtsK/SpoIIIE
MAKRKKRSHKKVVKSSAPQHSLPTGFWSQVGAVFLMAVSLLFVVTWFGAGGPVLEWIYQATLNTIGYAVYVIPVLFVYVAVEIFRAEENRLPFVMKLATVTSIVWFAALFGLLQNGEGESTGGYVGDLVNSGVLTLVNAGVAVFIYILLILITILFIIRVSPFTVIKKLWELIRRNDPEQEANVKIMKNAAAIDAPKSNAIADFKLNEGVPTIDQGLPQSRMSTFRNSVKQDRAAEEQAALVTFNDPNWKAPSLDLLEKKQSPADAGDVQQNAQIIKDTLSEFDIEVDMEGANVGPKVTQYTLRPPSGVKLSKIAALETNIALNLAAQSLRIEAPIPGQKAVGIEVPNRKAADVRLHAILTSDQWKANKEPLTFAIGKDISGNAVLGELNKMPHLLIAGQTGSGKSVMINTLLTSLLYHNSPSEMKLILVDPKEVEMAAYQDIPHLLTPIISEPDKTISALKWAVNEMQRRYSLMAEHRVKDIKSYNNKMRAASKKIVVSDEDELQVHQEQETGDMPYIVIVIDELADLMMIAARDVEALIVRLAQKARAVGIHLVLATQRPSVNVITGLIKANIPARIAFTVPSQIDSRTILDQIGAEKLLGQGDMFIVTAEMNKPRRIQGALVTDDEVQKVMTHLHLQSPPQYNDEVVAQPVQLNGKGGVVMDFDSGSDDGMYKDALRVVVDSGKASASLLQRRLRVGYARAARLIETMEDQGIIGPADGARPREVLISSLDELSPDTTDDLG